MGMGWIVRNPWVWAKLPSLLDVVVLVAEVLVELKAIDWSLQLMEGEAMRQAIFDSDCRNAIKKLLRMEAKRTEIENRVKEIRDAAS
ncbi:unnamed protein product [Linum trigynum]|uniref:Uncharacterized protein n=1 Tax=Linum trigynum TaxID=586398 RepID=A0AAV2FML7_9ROSI